MKALVTGAAGQVGQAVLANAPPGWTCIGLARADLDIADTARVAERIARDAPEVVFNCAAYTAVDRAEAEETHAFAINAEAVGHLASAARRAGALLVQLSSDYVFAGRDALPYSPGALRNPLSAYGRSKAAGEDAAGEAALVVRASWVYAAGHANFVTTMLRLMRERDELAVVADQRATPTWATNLARTLWGLVAIDARGVWHHRDGGEASWHEFAVALGEEAEALGLIPRQVPIRPITTAEFGAPAPRPAYSVLDDSLTRRALGDSVPHWRDNLRAMLREQRAWEAARG